MESIESKLKRNDKRYILDDGIKTLNYGHKNLLFWLSRLS